MNIREKMIKFREEHLLTIKDMADRCGVSNDIIGMVEKGEVTHPTIVAKIAEGYGLTDLEAEELMPKNRRPHGPEYDPYKYVVEPPINISVKRKHDVYDDYIHETHTRKGQY